MSFHFYLYLSISIYLYLFLSSSISISVCFYLFLSISIYISIYIDLYRCISKYLNLFEAISICSYVSLSISFYFCVCLSTATPAPTPTPQHFWSTLKFWALRIGDWRLRIETCTGSLERNLQNLPWSLTPLPDIPAPAPWEVLKIELKTPGAIFNLQIPENLFAMGMT